LRKKDSVKDWQVRQAAEALWIYRYHFPVDCPGRKKSSPSSPPTNIKDQLTILQLMLRLRRYSPPIEKTYLQR